jgi:predicted DNA-binding transcriptional regulator AlpA
MYTQLTSSVQNSNTSSEIHDNYHSFRSIKEPSQRLLWPGMMNISTLADYLDMSVTTVSNLVKSGDLPPPTIAPTPRLRRWSREAVDEHFRQKSDDAAIGPSIDQIMANSSASFRGCM